MSAPTVGAMQRLKRVARYLIGHGRWVQRFEEQDPTSVLRVYTDSDGAADLTDRKSVSCVAVMLGSHCIKCKMST